MGTAHTVVFWEGGGGEWGVGGTDFVPVWPLKNYVSWITYISVNKHAEMH